MQKEKTVIYFILLITEAENTLETPYHQSPDDKVFKFLAKTYSKTHPRMHLANENACGPNSDAGFTDGITNGADWYPVAGIYTN